MKFFEWIKGLAAKDGVTLDDMPPTFSEADVQAKVEAAVKEKTKQMETAFSEKITALDADKAVLSAREEALRQKEAEARQKAVVSFCEDLKKKGVLTPAMEKVGMGITEFMQVIAPLSTVVEFSEGNVKKNQTPLEFMQAFLSALPKQIEFSEVAGGDKGEGGNSEKREALINNFMEKNRVSYRDAVLAVSKSNPELFKKED